MPKLKEINISFDQIRELVSQLEFDNVGDNLNRPKKDNLGTAVFGGRQTSALWFSVC